MLALIVIVFAELLLLKMFLTVLGLTAGSAVLVGMLFLKRFHLISKPEHPKTVLDDLAHMLRADRHRVERRVGHLRVRVKGGAGVKVYAKETDEGTEVSFAADLTPEGWTIVVITMFIVSYGVIAFLYAIYVFLKSRRFAQDTIHRLLSVGRVRPKPGSREEVRELLVGSLSEGQRLAEEAYETQKSNYEDAVLLGTVLGTGAFACLLMLVLYELDWGPDRMNALTIVFPSTAVIGFGVFVWLVLRWRWMPHLKKLKGWSDVLNIALTKELSDGFAEHADPGVFDLLSEVCSHIPEWLKARQPGGVYRSPFAWFFIIFGGLTAAQLLILGLTATYHDTVVTLTATSFGAVVVIAIVVVIRRVRNVAREETERELTEWKSRFAELERKADRFLQEL